jgi:uncharacterized protein YigA (DUF484 family)
MTEPKCETCGVPWTKHLGIMGTCQALQESLTREANYREQIEALLKQRDAALARAAVRCEHPEVDTCAKLWEADNARRQLESVDPALWEEFPYSCDTVEHVAYALQDARQRRDELAAAMTELGTVLSSSAAAWERCVEAVEKAREA